MYSSMMGTHIVSVFLLWQIVLLWILLYISLGACMSTSLWGVYLEVEFLRYQACCHILLQNVVNSYMPGSARELQLSTSHAQQCLLFSLNFTYLAVCAWSSMSLWFLLCISVITNEINWLLLMCIGHFVYSLLWRVYSRFYCLF